LQQKEVAPNGAATLQACDVIELSRAFERERERERQRLRECVNDRESYIRRADGKNRFILVLTSNRAWSGAAKHGVGVVVVQRQYDGGA
jgi:hypothetical protein